MKCDEACSDVMLNDESEVLEEAIAKAVEERKRQRRGVKGKRVDMGSGMDSS